jgi:hypothetical protein
MKESESGMPAEVVWIISEPEGFLDSFYFIYFLEFAGFYFNYYSRLFVSILSQLR